MQFAVICTVTPCVRKQLEMVIAFVHHGHRRFNVELLSSQVQFTQLYSDTSHCWLLLF